MLDIATPGSFGGLWVGLDATPTGSDAAFDVVADFTGTAETLFTSPSIVVPVLAAHSQVNGSTFKIAAEGVWDIAVDIAAQTAASVRAAISIDGLLAEFSVDPVYSTRTQTVKLRIATAADTDPITLEVKNVIITRALALNPAAALVRVLLSNNAGAGAAAASLVLPLCALRITRSGNIPRADSLSG